MKLAVKSGYVGDRKVQQVALVGIISLCRDNVSTYKTCPSPPTTISLIARWRHVVIYFRCLSYFDSELSRLLSSQPAGQLEWMQLEFQVQCGYFV